MMAITTTDELKGEINRLKLLSGGQLAALKNRVSSPPALMATVRSLFKGSDHAKDFRGDYFSLVSKSLIPLALNKTIFRHSNFIIKMLASFVSGKVASKINQNTITKGLKMVKRIFGPASTS